MLTPRFELSQDEEFLVVLIRTPYVKVADVDFSIDGREFKFYVKPYFLRLNLPGEIVEDGRECASYDVEKGTFTVKLPKRYKAEPFEGLDLLTKLLAPVKKATKQPLIEVIGSSLDVEADDCNEDDLQDSDWEVNQQLPTEEDAKFCLGSVKYGFANEKHGVFSGRQEELHELAEIRDPESLMATERTTARLVAEQRKFDEEHYLADFFNDEQIQGVLLYQPPWEAEYRAWIDQNDDQVAGTPADGTIVTFTEGEKDHLRRLPNKEHLLDKSVETSLCLGLVDIIFAYAYNHRTTEGENTVESPWTISRISSTFSWFESFSSLSDVLVACFRRSLCQPLYRHWSLASSVLEDTKKIFTLGRRRLLKCLLEVHALFAECEPWYILNDLYVTDYCVWIQKTGGKKLESLARKIQEVKIQKSDIGWELEELEAAALAVREEEQRREVEDGVEEDSNNVSTASAADDDDDYEEDDDEDDDEEDDDEDVEDDDDDGAEDDEDDDEEDDDEDDDDDCYEGNEAKDESGNQGTEGEDDNG